LELTEIEEKWQREWIKQRVFEADPDGRKKFFITIPYPYLNGNLHAGHTRTFTIGDVIARFKRMKGFNVLFPMGFHVTGTPIIGLAELIAKKDPQTMEVYSRYHDVPLDILTTLTTPERIVEYFSKEAEEAMKAIGFSIDWRRKFTTTDDTYKKFIEWQFRRLKEKNLVVKGSHPVRYCPHDQNPVEDHDILVGDEATIVDYTVIKFKLDGVIFPCATLRPETVFGVTNIWLNPEGRYFLVNVDDEQWVVSVEAEEKLRFTDKNVEIIREVDSSEFFGKYVLNPVTGDKVPVLPATFVDGDSATGVVMSVPAHAPYDYVALKELEKNDEILVRYGIDRSIIESIKPIVLIEIEGFKIPAEDVVVREKIKSQIDHEKLERVTKLIYKKEFHKGVLNQTTGKYAGKKVSEVKDLLVSELMEKKIADVFYEFSVKPVICRCGTKCVVRVVKDQWFLNYSNPEWKQKVMKCLENMDIIPEAYRIEFENKIDWLKDKACARRKGLGTKLPWDPEWLIESLADSTIYMAYYVLASYINSGLIIADNLNDEFFDYVFYGLGDGKKTAEKSGISEDLLNLIREEFEYWYPVDLRSSGKDLVANHLLFFLFHHVALFPPEKWPKAIAVNGYVSLEGKKMSKSKGPLLTMKRAVKKYGADATRLYILSKASHLQDVDWRKKEVENIVNHLYRFIQLAEEMFTGSGPESTVDTWMMSRLNFRIKEVTLALEKLETRDAIHTAFYELMNDVRWYMKRGGKKLLKDILHIWVRLIAPFTPHIAEEVFSWFEEGLVSTASFPEWDESLISKEVEIQENYLISVMDDIREVVSLIKKEDIGGIWIYVAPEWKKKVVESSREWKDPREAMKAIFKDKFMREKGKEVSQLITEVYEGKVNMDFALLDEFTLLNRERKFLENEFKCKVIVERAESPKYDPQNRSKRASPGKPAIYVE
jgi:leucyl-tRNA synthetase